MCHIYQFDKRDREKVAIGYLSELKKEIGCVILNSLERFDKIL